MKIIKTKETYTQNGVEKIKWHEVGIVFDKDGKEFLKLHINPYITYYIFEQKEKDNSQTA